MIASDGTVYCDGELLLFPAFFSPSVADDALRWLLHGIDWRQESITLFGRVHPVPRLTAWYADPGCAYAYSGIVHEPRPWPHELARIRAQIERSLGVRFNSVLCNLYRDGADGNGWHADDERELGPQPTIASASFGAARMCRFRTTADRLAACAIELEHGSLLVMRGTSQARLQHHIPKSRRAFGPRVNLTFRTIVETTSG